MMNTYTLDENRMRFFDEGAAELRESLLTTMADAVKESREAADHFDELNENGRLGLTRMAEIWTALRSKEGAKATFLAEPLILTLADLIAQLYAHLNRCNITDPLGLAVCVELHYMMASLMRGEWFE